MTQEELIQAITKRFFLTQRESKEIFNLILSSIRDDLKRGRRVFFREFGSFTKEKRAARKVRHPTTGRLISIPQRIWIRFNASNFLLKKIQ